MNDIGIIIPVYNEEDCIIENMESIIKLIHKQNIYPKFLLVDDGSKDKTKEKLEELKTKYEKLEYISFTRNFGKEIAICAGLDNLDTDYYVIMDSDLQHPPSCLKEMLNLVINEGYDIVDGVRKNRPKESIIYRGEAKVFYSLLNKLTNMNLQNSSDFKVLTKEVVEALKQFQERELFFRGVVEWVGFKRINYYFVPEVRAAGDSSFSKKSLMKLALNAVITHTSKPLYFVFSISILFLIFAVLLGIETLHNYAIHVSVQGFTTVILLILITSSVVMFALGVIGLYISRIYDEAKQRPRYILYKHEKGKKI